MGAGLLLGAILNWLTHSALISTNISEWVQWALIDGVLDIVGTIFIASLKLLVVPLVFVSLVCGCSALGDNTRMGSMAIKTLSLYLLTTAVAVSLALLVANILNPGVGMNMGEQMTFTAKEAPSLKNVLIKKFMEKCIARPLNIELSLVIFVYIL